MIIVILLSLSALAIFLCTNESLRRKLKYPIINQDQFEDLYGDDLKTWQKDAILDYDANKYLDLKG